MQGAGPLRAAAFAEGMTLIFLIGIALPLKYGFGIPQATKVFGLGHGICFLWFAWAVIHALAAGSVTPRQAAFITTGAFVPFGGIFSERWLRRHERHMQC